jgi:uncharacterized protein YyaL (SSP411 family)
MPNHLAGQTSPYLLQHANNPVDWYPWGEEAFAKARAEDKPVLVSIGYAACHWCHVMEAESFEDRGVADKMNESFVSIKVDREERPDVDGIYMRAIQALTGQGGWPLNVFLMPDGKPFFGGTYFPSPRRAGMPSWSDVLDEVSDGYRNRKGDVIQNAVLLTEHIKKTANIGQTRQAVSEAVLDAAYAGIQLRFESSHGGFGHAPKFPQTPTLEFLLRYHARTGDSSALEMVEQSLRGMAHGGIYDHLGGGFARYSTDDRWMVPHFEKMLYDNTLLASVYLECFQATGSNDYRVVVQETLGYLMREMLDPKGGFYSSQDADSEGVEGKYYVWSEAEIDATLGEERSERFKRAYGVTPGGNFEGSNILHIAGGIREALDEDRLALRELRSKRIAPATDDKVLTSWNGLALRAFADAGAVLGEQSFIDVAIENADFLLSAMSPAGRLLRTWKDGTAHLNAYLEDYAYLINGLLSLHSATFGHRWLHEAKTLTDRMLDLFWDEASQALYDVGDDHETLIVRPRDTFDNGVPSGNSSATEALFRMGTLTGEARYMDMAVGLMESMAPMFPDYGLGLGKWLSNAERYVSGPEELAIVGPRDDPGTRELLRVAYAAYRPHLVIAGMGASDGEPFSTPVLAERHAIEGKPTAYFCRSYTCDLPTTNPGRLAAQLSA